MICYFAKDLITFSQPFSQEKKKKKESFFTVFMSPRMTILTCQVPPPNKVSVRYKSTSGETELAL